MIEPAAPVGGLSQDISRESETSGHPVEETVSVSSPEPLLVLGFSTQSSNVVAPVRAAVPV
jgi:hypothetical protein